MVMERPFRLRRRGDTPPNRLGGTPRPTNTIYTFYMFYTDIIIPLRRAR